MSHRNLSHRNLRGALPLGLALCWMCPPALAQDRITSQLDALQREPTVREVQEAALRYFRVNRDTVSSMRTRAGWKAILPIAEVSGGYTSAELDEDTINRVDYKYDDPATVRGSGGQAWEIRGKLAWDLPKLVFNAEELDVASLAGLMEGILKESTRLYFMRRRLQVDMVLTPPTDRASVLTKELRLEELTALLDAMTGGWFQQEMALRFPGRQSGGRAMPASRAAAPAVPEAAPAPLSGDARESELRRAPVGRQALPVFGSRR